MERTSTMVREYVNQADFTADEQKLGQEGWSVASTVQPKQKQGMIERLRSRFAATQAPTNFVVTYTRPKPF